MPQASFLKGYRVLRAEEAIEKGLLSSADLEVLGTPDEVCLLYALGSWTLGETVCSEATYIIDAGCAAGLVERFESAGGGRNPGLTCGSGYWDTLVDLALPDGCPHLLAAGWSGGWRPEWEMGGAGGPHRPPGVRD